MQDWLVLFSGALSREFPDFPAGVAPSTELAEDLLNLAKIVADGTGQRTNAPLTTYVVGYLAGVLAGSGLGQQAAVSRATEIAGRILNGEA